MMNKHHDDLGQPEDTMQSFQGENVVAGIRASGKARVEIHQTIYTHLSEADEERQRQQAELAALEGAVQQKFEHLQRLIESPLPGGGNPFLFLQPFGLSDAGRYFGRQTLVADLMARLKGYTTTFLDGNRGVGKTSLMRAGLIPVLLKQGCLPLFVSLESEGIISAVKKELLPNVGAMPFVLKMSLTEFLYRVSDCLPHDKWLAVLVDDFDLFVEQEAAIQKIFRSEWQRCVRDAAPDVRWLFCIASDQPNVLNFFRPELQPDPNTITVRPLDRAGAIQALAKPAEQHHIQVDVELVETIVEALGGENVYPAQLQLTGYMLAGGRDANVTTWTMDTYKAQGGVNGILREYLDRTIATLDDDRQEPAWQVLAVLADPRQPTATEAQVVAAMKEQYDVSETVSRRALADLQQNHLVERARAFRLASDSLRPRIEKWLAERSTRQRLHLAAQEQLRSIRNSALRGLLGGALGFSLAYICLPYVERPTAWDESIGFYAYNVGLRALSGGIAGFLMVLTIDMIFASFSFRRKKSHLLLAAGAGMVGFALLLVMHTFWHYFGDNFPLALARSALQGALWGGVVGAGMALDAFVPWRKWYILGGTCLLSGVVLVLGEVLFGGLEIQPGVDVFLAGLLLPLGLLSFTRDDHLHNEFRR